MHKAKNGRRRRKRLDILWPRRVHLGYSHTQSSGEPVLSEAIHFLLVVQLHVQLVVKTITAVTTHNADRATREEYNPLEFLVVEEVVEGPEAPLFTKRVRVQIRVVAENKY